MGGVAPEVVVAVAEPADLRNPVVGVQHLRDRLRSSANPGWLPSWPRPCSLRSRTQASASSPSTSSSQPNGSGAAGSSGVATRGMGALWLGPYPSLPRSALLPRLLLAPPRSVLLPSPHSADLLFTSSATPREASGSTSKWRSTRRGRSMRGGGTEYGQRVRCSTGTAGWPPGSGYSPSCCAGLRPGRTEAAGPAELGWMAVIRIVVYALPHGPGPAAAAGADPFDRQARAAHTVRRTYAIAGFVMWTTWCWPACPSRTAATTANCPQCWRAGSA